jgi:hypothetical protein
MQCNRIQTVFPLLNEESLHLQLSETQLLHRMVESASDYFNCLPCLKQPSWIDCTSGLNVPSNVPSSESCGSSPANTSGVPALSYLSPVHHTFAVQHYTSIVSNSPSFCLPFKPNLLTHSSSSLSDQVTYNVSDFQLRNAEHVLSRDVCSALFHSNLAPLSELFPEANPGRTPLRRPASRCAQMSTGFIRVLDTLCSSRKMHFTHCIRPNRLLPTRQLTLVPTSQSVVTLNKNALPASSSTHKSPKFTKRPVQQCKLMHAQSSSSGVTCSCSDQEPHSIPSSSVYHGAPIPINHRPITPMASSSSSGSSAPVKKPIVITIALDSQYVLEQVRALQLAPFASLQAAGFAQSIEYSRFYKRFSLLILDFTKQNVSGEFFVEIPPMAEELELLRTARALANKQTTINTSFIKDPSAVDRFCPFSCDHRQSRTSSTSGRPSLCPWFLHQTQTNRTLIANQANDYLVRCAHLLLQLQVPTEQVQLGHSRIFFRHLQTWFRLERLRTLRLDHLVRRIQRVWRLSLARRNFLVIRRSQQVISRSYLTWKVAKIRPFLSFI